MGDACGIGPEILAQLFRGPDAGGCMVVGDVGVMQRAVALTGGLMAVARITAAHDVAQVPPPLHTGPADRRRTRGSS